MRVFHLLHEVRAVELSFVGQGSQTGRHIQRTGLVLTQRDAFEWRAAVFLEGLTEARELLGDTEAMRHIGHGLRAAIQRTSHADEGGVQRQLQRLRNGARTTGLSSDVRHLCLTSGDGGGVERVINRSALIQVGGQAEDLERGTRLHWRVSEVPAHRIVTAVVGAHATGLRINGNDSPADAFHLALKLLMNLIHCSLLRHRVNRGRNAQTAGVDLILSDACFLKLLDHSGLDQPIGALGLGGLACLGRILGFRVFRVAALRLVNPPRVEHAVKHIIPALLGTLAIRPRV